MREQRVSLKDVPDAPLLRPEVDALGAVEQRASGGDDAARVGRDEAGDALQRQGLSGARRPDERDDRLVAGPGGVEREIAELLACGDAQHQKRSRAARPSASIREQDDADAHERQHVGLIELIGLHVIVDGERKGLGAAGNVARHHQRDAEVAERPAERQHGAGQNRAPRERHRDRPEDAQLRVAERCGGLLEPAIDRFEARLRRLDQQRKRTDGGGEHCGAPGECELDVPSGERAADAPREPMSISR